MGYVGTQMSGEDSAETLELRIRPALRRAAERAAAEDGASLPGLIEKLLTEHLSVRGLLRGPGSDEGLRPDQLSAENDG